MLAGALLAQSRGLPSGGCVLGLSDRCEGGPGVLRAYELVWMCMRVRLSRRRSMGEVARCFGRG